MKDILITKKRQKTELVTLLVCFVIANLFNVYAICTYNGAAIELIMSLGFVTVFTVVLYVAWTVVRLLLRGVRRLFVSSKK